MPAWMVRAFWGAVVTSALVVSTSPAVWAQAEDLGRQRPYFGLGLAYAQPNFERFGNTQRDAEATFGLDVRAGYRWKWVAAEVNYQFYTRFDIGGTVGADSFRGMTIGPNVKFYPLHGRFQPYLLVGTGLQHYEKNPVDDRDAAMFRSGGGIELYFMENIAVFAEGTYVLGIGSDLDVIPVIGGLQIHM